MSTTMSIIIAIFLSVMSSLIGFIVWLIQKKLNNIEYNLTCKREDALEYDRIVLEGVSTSLSLGIATAIAIRDKKSNGNIDKALEEALVIKKRKDKYIKKMADEAISKTISRK